jgi:hypothetical protein
MNHDDNLFLAMRWVNNKPSDDMRSLVDTDQMRIAAYQSANGAKIPPMI